MNNDDVIVHLTALQDQPGLIDTILWHLLPHDHLPSRGTRAARLLQDRSSPSSLCDPDPLRYLYLELAHGPLYPSAHVLKLSLARPLKG